MKFLLTKSDLAFDISQVNTLNTGKIEILLRVKNPLFNACSLETFEYSLDGAVWLSCVPDVVQEVDFNSIQLTARYALKKIIWDAARDLGVDIVHTAVLVRIALNDRANLAGEISELKTFTIPSIDFTPADPSIFVRPMGNTDEPVFQFQSVETPVECRIHFKLTVSENEDLSDPIVVIESSTDQVGWTVDEDPLPADGCTGHEPHLISYSGIAGLTQGKEYFFKVEESASHFYLQSSDGFYLASSDSKLLTSY